MFASNSRYCFRIFSAIDVCLSDTGVPDSGVVFDGQKCLRYFSYDSTSGLKGKIFEGIRRSAVGGEVKAAVACACRSEERQAFKVLAGSPAARLLPDSSTSASGPHC